MKQVGIVTYFNGINYGQLLQAYGLSAIVTEIGYNCEIINIPMKNTQSFAVRLLNLAIQLCTNNPLHVLRRKASMRKLKRVDDAFQNKYKAELSTQKELFAMFRERKLSIGKVIYSNTKKITADPPSYDAYICGSDQIWNPNAIFPWKRHEYFLSFAPQKKRIAYAPSFGVSQLPKRYVSDYIEWISQLPHLSCREAAGMEIIKELTGRDAVHVLDPTLLLQTAEWDKLASESKIFDNNEPYILCYITGTETAYERFLQSVIAELNCRVITLSLLSDRKGYEHTICFEAGPMEFVSLIKHAVYVITDSFHGTAFSILYNKPFVVFQKNSGFSSIHSQFSRIDSLLSMCKIKPPLADESSVFHRDMLDIDFTTANNVLQCERKNSMQYLAESLEKAIIS